MQPLIVPDRRGKKAKITVELVRRVVEAATTLKAQGKRLRIKEFTKKLSREDDIELSSKKVAEILIANGLHAVKTKRKRPRFYQSLRQRIPNALVSADGSEFTVWIDGEPQKFNVELAVEVDTFAHTAFSIADSETSEEVIGVLEAHRKAWGSPLGLLCDHDSANLSDETRAYLKEKGIELVAAGPANPKGNGTVEGAFSQMKEVLGPIRLEVSSHRALAKSVLEKLISVYIQMRNRLPLQAKTTTPKVELARPVDEFHREAERQRLKKHLKAKATDAHDQPKLDRLHYLIGHYGLTLEASELKRAQYCIKAYDLEAIRSAEEAFVKAVTRKKERLSLAYFFGILKRIQNERDNDAHRRYCQNRYNLQVRQETQRRQQQEAEQSATVNELVTMLHQAVCASARFVKELAIRQAQRMARTLMENYRYIGSLKKQIANALAELRDMSIVQKQEAWELVEQFLKPKSIDESVTLIS